MGLDINAIRVEKGGNPDEVRESQRRRNPHNPDEAVSKVDQAIALDEEWRKKNYQTDELRKAYGKIMKEVGKLKKASKGKDPCTEMIAEGQELKAQIEVSGNESDALKSQLEKVMSHIGNLVHDSVPVHHDEEHNETIRTWGTPRELKVTQKPGFCHHHQVLHMIGGYDPKRGQKVAGHRGFFLTGPGALLNLALINYGIQFLTKKGYTPVQTPFFMKRHLMAKTAQLDDFDDQLYKLESGENTEKKDDCFLIATAEQPVSSFYSDEWIEKDQLPIRFAGWSSCFRKEAGAHGKDVWGIFRVHQFEKVEQFCIVEGDKSWEEHEKMCTTSEEFLQSLGLPYRTVAIISKELQNAAAKKYDIEAWFPGYGEYKELVSCSNCTDYQSRALNIRLRTPKTPKTEQKKEFVHMLNGTLVATERTLCCLLETYQEEEGLRVPEVLVPFVGTDFIPYVNEVPKVKGFK